MTARNQQRPPCAAATAKGTPCSNAAKAGSDRCGAHSGNAGRPQITPSTVLAGNDEATFGAAICGLARIGTTKRQAAIRVGLAPATVASWIERGEADIEANSSSEFSEFLLDFWKAEVALVTDLLQEIHRAAKGTDEKPGDWRAALALLERLRAEEFSLTHRVEHSGEVNIVEQHAEQLLVPLLAILTELGVADDPRVPDLIEKHFTPLE